MPNKQQTTNNNNIVIFNPEIVKDHEDYNSTGLDILYAAEEKHFWFIVRKQRIINIFKKYVQKHESVLEIGAGTGNVARALQTAGYDVSVGEMHLNGLCYAKSYGIKNCYQFDLFDPPFSEHFDVIGMFDVLEHLQEDVLAMQCVQSMLKPNGRIVLTVPAHKWLWNRDDAIAAHKRRYTLKELKMVMEKAGFEILHGRYFFVSILPLLFL
jgi:2-polyprenyl-3-methyl-5-hydroxy-6-metoxy-1,4-benzoquinol methylase